MFALMEIRIVQSIVTYFNIQIYKHKIINKKHVKDFSINMLEHTGNQW
jgi:hypothetical protein